MKAIAFLRRLVGSSAKQQEEEQRFKDNLKKLEEQEEELDEVAFQLDRIQKEAESKQSALSTTMVEFENTVRLTTEMPSASIQEVIEKAKAAGNDEEEERPSGEPQPTGT